MAAGRARSVPVQATSAGGDRRCRHPPHGDDGDEASDDGGGHATSPLTGLAITAGAAMLLSTATGNAHYATDLLPGLVLLGLGVGMVLVPVSVTAMAGIPAQHAGMASCRSRSPSPPAPRSPVT